MRWETPSSSEASFNFSDLNGTLKKEIAKEDAEKIVALGEKIINNTFEFRGKKYPLLSDSLNSGAYYTAYELPENFRLDGAEEQQNANVENRRFLVKVVNPALASKEKVKEVARSLLFPDPTCLITPNMTDGAIWISEKPVFRFNIIEVLQRKQETAKTQFATPT